MKNSLISAALVFSFILVVVFACDDTLPPDDNLIPDKTVSYKMHIQPVLNIKCAVTGCHNSESMAGGFSAQSWTDIYRLPLIDIGVPNNSYLYMTVKGLGGLPIMPPIGASVYPMSEKEVKGLYTWILEGAKNN